METEQGMIRQFSHSFFLPLIGFLAFQLIHFLPSVAISATLFESGTLGPTGLAQGSVTASNISASVYAGARFRLTQPVKTTQIGGHFVSATGDNFFGAIVELGNANDFPDSGDLTTSDVLGTAELNFPVLSDEVFGNLDLTLYPGWYALVFGSGLFDTTGDGAAPLNNPDIGSPKYIAFQPGFGWNNLTGFLSDFRFVVEGNVIPEPTTFSILVASSFFILIRRRK